MEKGQNILHNTNIKRIVEYSEDTKQINIFDQRYYKRNDKFYPSVSTVLNYFPKINIFMTGLEM